MVNLSKKILNLFKPEKKSFRADEAFPEYMIVFKPDAFEKLKSVKGWKTNKEIAAELDVTEGYVSGLKNGKVAVTSTIITRMAHLTGNTKENWHVFYSLRFVGFKKRSDPRYNMAKYKGERPYSWGSTIAEIRKKDGVNDGERLGWDIIKK